MHQPGLTLFIADQLQLDPGPAAELLATIMQCDVGKVLTDGIMGVEAVCSSSNYLLSPSLMLHKALARCDCLAMLLYHGLLSYLIKCANDRLAAVSDATPLQEVVIMIIPAPELLTETSDWSQLMRNVIYDAMTTVRPSLAQKSTKVPEANEFNKRSVKAIAERFLQRCGMNRTVHAVDKTSIRVSHASDLVCELVTH